MSARSPRSPRTRTSRDGLGPYTVLRATGGVHSQPPSGANHSSKAGYLVLLASERPSATDTADRYSYQLKWVPQTVATETGLVQLATAPENFSSSIDPSSGAYQTRSRESLSSTLAIVTVDLTEIKEVAVSRHGNKKPGMLTIKSHSSSSWTFHFDASSDVVEEIASTYSRQNDHDPFIFKQMFWGGLQVVQWLGQVGKLEQVDQSHWKSLESPPKKAAVVRMSQLPDDWDLPSPPQPTSLEDRLGNLGFLIRDSVRRGQTHKPQKLIASWLKEGGNDAFLNVGRDALELFQKIISTEPVEFVIPGFIEGGAGYYADRLPYPSFKLREEECRDFSPVSLDEWKGWFDESGKLSKPVREVKARIFYGGLRPEVRPTAYPFLLGVYDWDSTTSERQHKMHTNREAYEKVRQEWYQYYGYINLPPEDIPKDQQAPFEDWRREFEKIVKDVHRLDRERECFSDGAGSNLSPQESVESNPHLFMCCSILLTYHQYNSALGYVQGMSDLLSPLYHDGSDDSTIFWCFVKFMEQMEPNFLRNQKGMTFQLRAVSDLLRVIDAPLMQQLERTECGDFFFIFRSVLLRFKREMAWDAVFRLWEAFWTNYLSSNFHLFVAAALTMQYRERLFEQAHGPDKMMFIFSKIEGRQDSAHLLEQAQRLYFRLADIVAGYDKKMGIISPLETASAGSRPAAPEPAAQIQAPPQSFQRGQSIRTAPNHTPSPVPAPIPAPTLQQLPAFIRQQARKPSVDLPQAFLSFITGKPIIPQLPPVEAAIESAIEAKRSGREPFARTVRLLLRESPMDQRPFYEE